MASSLLQLFVFGFFGSFCGRAFDLCVHAVGIYCLGSIAKQLFSSIHSVFLVYWHRTTHIHAHVGRLGHSITHAISYDLFFFRSFFRLLLSFIFFFQLFLLHKYWRHCTCGACAIETKFQENGLAQCERQHTRHHVRNAIEEIEGNKNEKWKREKERNEIGIIIGRKVTLLTQRINTQWQTHWQQRTATAAAGIVAFCVRYYRLFDRNDCIIAIIAFHFFLFFFWRNLNWPPHRHRLTANAVENQRSATETNRQHNCSVSVARYARVRRSCNC